MLREVTTDARVLDRLVSPFGKDELGEFGWIDPGNPPDDLFPATAALLERLP